jgi:hypothetical protein
MCTVSSEKEALSITIRNLYPSLELASPVHLGISTMYCPPPSQTDAGTITEVSFGIDVKQEVFKGALLYKLQKKYATKTDNQPNGSSASIENTATNLHFLVVWDVGNDHRNCHVWLIECTEEFTWDEDKLWALYREYNDQFYKDAKSNIITWSMPGGAVMKTRRDITYEYVSKLDITVSEGAGKYNMLKPIQIDPKRSVIAIFNVDYANIYD